ncbi:DUF885 family protein [Kangiella sp. TOML190]|uniref:DUF885 domain-containing protein n=1 Tax=Kangiella sp. TOML190 TaxID=2931351 RepID=UPI00203D5572|nr:DUF885 domain-containing protein [Kangiella sp. TOML190]
MRLTRFLSAASLLLLSLTNVQLFAEEMNATAKLHQLFDQVESYQLSLNPIMAANKGDKSARGKLPDYSSQAYAKKAEKLERFRQQLLSIATDSLSTEDKVSYQMMLRNLDIQLSDINYKSYQMPLTAEYGFHIQAASLGERLSFKTLDDYENYLTLLAQVPTFFQQNIDNMKAGLARNFSVPQQVLAGYSDGIAAYIQEDPSQSVWYKPFAQLAAGITESEAEKLREKAKNVIKNKVIAEFVNYKNFFDKEYYPKAKKTIAATDYPDGKAFYQAQVKRYTTLDLTPEQIHEIGRKEVKRIRAEMEQVIEDTGFDGSFAEFLNFLRTDPQFYAKTPEELLKEAAYISKKMDHKLPKFFGKLPRQPYGVVAVAPEIAPKYTTGRYSGAPLDSTRAGEYWVNTYALDKRPLYNLEALSLHEAVPGHHLQTALAKELDHLPKFRQNTYISAFGEGWGLYSERLGLEAGFYQDPYSNFGRLTYEMWRAMRLVVDTGMHAMGMSRAEAIKLMEDNTALSTHNVRTEIDRYISWPGQALSYKLGEIKIRELRAKAEQALGQDFDIRKFHDAVLGQGSVPLSVLEDQINDFIRQQKAEDAKTE